MKTTKSSKKFSTEDVKHVAKLANLPLTDKEYQVFFPQLAAILGFVSKLQQIETKNVVETSQVTGQTNVFREDEIEVTRQLSQEEALKNAKAKHNGFFIVSAIFK